MASLANLFSPLEEDPAAAEAPLLSASSASHAGDEEALDTDGSARDDTASRLEDSRGSQAGEGRVAPQSPGAYEDYSVELNDMPGARGRRGRVAALRAQADPEERLFKKRKASIADLVRPRFSSFAGIGSTSSSTVVPGESIGGSGSSSETVDLRDEATRSLEREQERERERERERVLERDAGPAKVEQKPLQYSVQQTAVGSYRNDLAEAAKEITRARQEALAQEAAEAEWLGENLVMSSKRSALMAKVRLTVAQLQHTIRSTNFLLLFLAVLGLLMGILSFLVDATVNLLRWAHFELTYLSDLWIVSFICWMAFLYVLLWIAIIVTLKVSLNAMGSGIPEMKSILSGVTLREYLSVRTMFAKGIGLSFALGAGIVVGKEGPFVHLASIIANQMFKFPLFSNIRRNGPLKHLIFTCAIAAGVAANFGAPIGGLLFSIEVASTYYPVRTYFYSAWCSVLSGYIFRVLVNLQAGNSAFTAFIATDFGSDVIGVFGFLDVGMSVLFGLAGGCLAPLFVFLHLLVVRSRRRFAKKLWLFKSVWPYSLAVATLTGVLLFPRLVGEYMSLSALSALRQLFSSAPLPTSWQAISLWISLPMFAVSRFYLTAFSICMPIPSGLVVPILAVGAALGRLFGEEVFLLLGGSTEVQDQLPGIAAVIGAAALVAGVTQTFSTAVIIFELTGQLVLLVPVTIATIVAIATSRGLTYSIYEGILQSRNLPYLPDITSTGYQLRASDIMDTSIVSKGQYLKLNCSYRELSKTLGECSTATFPVVRDHERKDLLGVVSRKRIKKLLHSYREEQLSAFADEQDEAIEGGSTWHNPLHTITKSFGSRFSTSQRSGSLRAGKGIKKSSSMDLAGAQLEANERGKFKKAKKRSQHHVTSLTMHPQHAETETHAGRARLFPPGFHEGMIHVPYEHSPIQLQTSTALTSVHMLFITLRLHSAYVTQDGRLLGVISREDLRRVIHENSIFDSLIEMI